MISRLSRGIRTSCRRQSLIPMVIEQTVGFTKTRVWKGWGGGITPHSRSFFTKFPHPAFFMAFPEFVFFSPQKHISEDKFLQKLINGDAYYRFLLKFWTYVSKKIEINFIPQYDERVRLKFTGTVSTSYYLKQTPCARIPCLNVHLCCMTTSWIPDGEAKNPSSVPKF